MNDSELSSAQHIGYPPPPLSLGNPSHSLLLLATLVLVSTPTSQKVLLSSQNLGMSLFFNQAKLLQLTPWRVKKNLKK